LKDAKGWDNWQRETLAYAHAQDIAEVFDAKHKPKEEDVTLFKAKQEFVYAIFVRTLQLDVGKHLVRTLGNQAQAIYKQLVTEMSLSTRAILESQTLHAFITGYRLTTTSWKGTMESFLLFWRDQLRKYENINEEINHADDKQKLNWLRNAVEGVGEFAHVRSAEDINARITKTSITYGEYFELLLGEAGRYDVKHAFATAPPKRTVYQHAWQYGEYRSGDDTDFDLDTPTAVVQAYATSRSSQRPTSTSPPVPRPQHDDYVSRDEWDKLSPEQRRTIQQKRLDRLQSSTNMHEATYAFLQANLHQIYLGSDSWEFVAPTSSTYEPPGSYRSLMDPTTRPLRTQSSVTLPSVVRPVHSVLKS
jgi:hypothetical protein